MKKKEFVAPTWDLLRRKVARWATGGYLRTVPEEYQDAMALALAVAKWSPERGKQRGDGECALCVRYDSWEGVSLRCEKCPLRAETGRRCFQIGTVFDKWGSASDQKVINKYAEQMYQILLKLYIKAYNRA